MAGPRDSKRIATAIITSSNNLALLGLGLIVWDRSEVLFLKQFADVKQVAFVFAGV